MMDPSMVHTGSTAHEPSLRRLVDAGRLERAVATRSRPSLLANERELSVLRRGLTKDGWKRVLYLQPLGSCHGIYNGAGLLSLANKWLERPINLPDWKDDRRATCCMDGPEVIVPEVGSEACAACPRFLGGSGMKLPVRMLGLLRLATGLVALTMAFAIDGDVSYSEQAMAILMALAMTYTDQPEHKPSVLEARCAVAFAQAYDLVFYARCWGDGERELVANKLLAPMARRVAELSTSGTEGAWRLSALGMIGLAIRNAGMVADSVTSADAWLRQLGSDGLAPGSLAGDHMDSLSAIVHLSEACSRSGIDLYGLEPAPGKSIKNMFVSPIHFVYPSFRLPAVGKSKYDSFLPLGLYEVALRRWGSKEFAWALKRGYSLGAPAAGNGENQHANPMTRTSFQAFAFGRDLPGRTDLVFPKARTASSQGLCCLRNTSSSMATLFCGSDAQSPHSDKLSYTLCFNGRLLAPDYGEPGAGAEPGGWQTLKWAHNTIVVDGESQAPADNGAEVAYFNGSEFQAARCVIDSCDLGVSHERTILLLGDMFVVSDRLTSAQTHVYDWVSRFEAEPKILSELPMAATELDLPRMIEIGSVFGVDGMARIDWQRNDGAVSHAIWSGPGESKLIVATCPAETAHRRVPMLISRRKGRDAQFISLFARKPEGREAKIKKSGRLLTIESGSRVDYILLDTGANDDKAVVHTDARLAAVRTSGGVVTSVVMAEGSRLSLNGRTVMECPSAVDYIEALLDIHGPQIRLIGGKPGVLQLRTSSRAGRINGARASASCLEGVARFGVTPDMLDGRR